MLMVAVAGIVCRGAYIEVRYRQSLTLIEEFARVQRNPHTAMVVFRSGDKEPLAWSEGCKTMFHAPCRESLMALGQSLEASDTGKCEILTVGDEEFAVTVLPTAPDSNQFLASIKNLSEQREQRIE